MKLSKKSWLFIALGIFLIALVGLWMVYSQQSGIQNQLNEELALVKSRLGSIHIESLAEERIVLEQQLDETLAQSEVAREKLSQPMNSIIINDILFGTAAVHSVNITEISAPVASEVVLDGVSCLTFPLTARVEGELDNLISFITELNGDFATATVKSVNIDIPQSGGDRKSSVSLQMVFYTYKES